MLNCISHQGNANENHTVILHTHQKGQHEKDTKYQLLGKDMKPLALSHIAGGVQMGMAILENHWHKVGKVERIHIHTCLSSATSK